MDKGNGKKVLMIGAGAVTIGGAGDLDFMAGEAARKLSGMGYEITVVNPDAQALSNSGIAACSVYNEPLDFDTLKKIIQIEKPDYILPFFGGKIAMILCYELAVKGVLEEYGIELPGLSFAAMEYCGDAVKFKNMMDSLGIPTHEGKIVHTVEEAERAAAEYNYHVVIRSPYSTYSNSNSLVFNKDELKRFIEPVLSSSLNGAALISEALINHNEYEFEIMRDIKNNIITVASVENINPLDVHSGDSAIVSPVMTLSKEEYEKMEKAAHKIAEAMEIVGLADVRFSRNPENGEWAVIKVTPSLSHIAAFAADVKGINSAAILAEIIFGAELSDIAYNGKTMLEYKEDRDFCSVRVPVFPFDSLPDAADILDTKMRSVGNAEGVGRNFREALQKAVRAAGKYGFGLLEKISKEELLRRLITPSSKDLYYIYEALRKSASAEEISRITCIDKFFVNELKEILLMENRLLKYRGRIPVEPVLINSKKYGFSDKYIGEILSVGEDAVRNNLAEIGAEKNRIKISADLYSTTCNASVETEKLTGKKALIIGGGPNEIGQSSELRYAAVCASAALKKMGYKTIYVNPVNVSDSAFDRVYLDSVTAEDVISICRLEEPEVIITQLAGKYAGALTKALEESGFAAAGINSRIYELINDKSAFKELALRLEIPAPQTELSTDIDEALAIAENIGYPVSVSCSGAGRTVYSSGEMLNYLESNGISAKEPVRIENFLYSAVEYEIDAIAFKDGLFIPQIMEHIESAGINTGDSACVVPPKSLSENQKKTILKYCEKLAGELKPEGFINIRFAADREKIYLLGASAGASRTLPFISKMCGINLTEYGIKAMLSGKCEIEGLREVKYFGVKEVVCLWDVFDECDPILGPDMRSSGSVMSLGRTFGEAFAKAQEAVGAKLPLTGNVFINLSGRDMEQLAELCREFIDIGFGVFTTSEHCGELKAQEIDVCRVKRISEGRPNIEDSIINSEVNIIVNTAADDSDIRRLAIRNNIAYMTTVSAAFAAVGGIKTVKKEKFEPIKLQSKACSE